MKKLLIIAISCLLLIPGLAKAASPIYSLSVSGTGNITADNGYIRIILTTESGHEYLVYEAAAPLNKESISFENHCEETCVLDRVTPEKVKAEYEGASVNVTEVNILKDRRALNESVSAVGLESYQQILQETQRENTIKKFNQYIKESDLGWKAGETPISKLSYEEKKKLFHSAEEESLSNLQGFQYYQGGVFETTETEAAPSDPDLPESFDWRNRHEENWLTSVKDQTDPQICGSCWAFAPLGVTEAMINLYFNQHLDLDLSEQQLLSCVYPNRDGCKGGFAFKALDYTKDQGVARENCFSYQGKDLPCGNVCSNWKSQKVSIEGYKQPIVRSNTDSSDLKETIIKEGPITGSPWRYHVMALVGWETNSKNETVWIFKNSWGKLAGEEGYAKVKAPAEDLYYTTMVTPPVSLADQPYLQIKCVDQDNDNYCNWGISSSKPSTCPASCKEERDCDDSDPALGPYNSNYKCKSIEDDCPNCQADHTDACDNKCEQQCDASPECDEKEPGWTQPGTNKCEWCSVDACQYESEVGKPLSYYSSKDTCYHNCSITCKLGGWKRKSCVIDPNKICDSSECTSSGWNNSECQVNQAPDKPTDPVPSDGTTGVSTFPTLSVDVSDPDGDNMDVTFYNASNDSTIGTDYGIHDGNTASVEWDGLSNDTSYDWYAVADDSSATTQSSTWNFTTGTAVTNDPTKVGIRTGDGSQSITITKNENFTLEVGGKDSNVSDTDLYLYYREENEEYTDDRRKSCSDTTCVKTWSHSKSSPGTYTYYAAANGWNTETDNWETVQTEDGAPVPSGYYSSVTITVEETTALDVNLNANPSSGETPLNNVDLTADVSGTASGYIDYKFDCTDDGYWDHTQSYTYSDPYTASDVCDYPSGGSYTARVQASREGLTAEDTATIKVSEPTNQEPNAPSNPSPSDGTTGVSTFPTLSVDVSDPDGDNMDVTFYNASNDSTIGTDYGIHDGNTASVEWDGLSNDTSYDWYAVADDSSATTQSSTWNFTTAEKSFTCGDSISFIYNGSYVTYGTVEYDGKCWMDRNLGADSVANAVNDSSSYGDYFQWGRLDDGHQDKNSNSTNILSSSDEPGNDDFIHSSSKPWDWREPQNDNMWNEDGSGTNNGQTCPEGWRVPSVLELDSASAGWSNYNDAVNSPLKMPSPGYRKPHEDTFKYVDEAGFYWSSSVGGSEPEYAQYLSFADSGIDTYSWWRGPGFPVRCIKENYNN